MTMVTKLLTQLSMTHDQKFVSPTIQRFEWIGCCHIIDENTTISATIEGHTQTLETFLTRCIPDLNEMGKGSILQSSPLHSTCMVTSRSSIWTSLVKKSAPIVALYWLENLCETNCPIKLVLPTPLSPSERRFPSMDLFGKRVSSAYPIWSL